MEDLKGKYQALQETIYFDESHYYREQTKNPEAVQNLITNLEGKLYEGGEDPYFLLGALGYCYRVINLAEKAIEVFKRCLETVGDNEKKKMIALIRMGEAYKYNNQHDLALQQFEKARKILRRGQFTEYVDFLYQHQAKCYFELNDLDKAEELLAKALELRIEKADESLIKSTRKVLDEVKRQRCGGQSEPDGN